MKSKIDTLFIAAFGGPTPGCCKRFDPCPGEAYCFVSGVFGFNEARKARVDEVAGHYKELGGYSKFNEITEKQAAALKSELARRGTKLDVRLGYYHWNPYIIPRVEEMARAGSKSFVSLVLAPHQSSLSWDAYLRRIAEGLEALPSGVKKPEWKGVADPFFDKPGFIEALADNTCKAAAKIGADFAAGDTGVLFSVHTIPMAVAKTSPYLEQVRKTADLLAEKLGSKLTRIGFQSRPTDSRIEWTSPSLENAIGDLVKAGAKKIVACAIGFLCDNVEVLYDMGIEGAQVAKKLGVKFAAAEAVNDHPAFIAALADQVEAAISKAP
ncbi:MAG: ferrochelatase [Planctomycetes bacterium]|nr:ferrochelatase [Planctomycetota bacterium]